MQHLDLDGEFPLHAVDTDDVLSLNMRGHTANSSNNPGLKVIV